MIIISPKGFQDIGSERYKKYLWFKLISVCRFWE
jgi:hypothetical protein